MGLDFFLVNYLTVSDDLGNNLVLGLIIRISVTIHPDVSGVDFGDSKSISVILQVHSVSIRTGGRLYLYVSNHVNRM